MPPPVYLLDTNILLHLIRGKSTGLYIDATYQLQKQVYTPLVCIVSHGEIWSLARENNWGVPKRRALEVMLNNLVTVDINSDQVIEAYVDVDDASRHAPGGAIVMGKNDLWIAAVAKVTKATFLTCDTDFDHLHPGQITRIYIDPGSSLPPSPPPPPTGLTP
jgi:tRNA(fMet)-specific endonuclease VapC